MTHEDETPEEEGGAYGQPGRKTIGLRQMFVWEQVPALMRLFGICSIRVVELPEMPQVLRRTSAGFGRKSH
jgi:hypothetical protein